MPAPLSSRLAVVYLYVTDMERSRDFYARVIGLDFEGDADWYEARLADGARFALHPARPGMEPRTPNTVRVDFLVDDLDEAVRRVEAAGVPAEQVQREPYGSWFHVVDPDGYELGFFAPPS